MSGGLDSRTARLAAARHTVMECAVCRRLTLHRGSFPRSPPFRCPHELPSRCELSRARPAVGRKGRCQRIDLVRREFISTFRRRWPLTRNGRGGSRRSTAVALPAWVACPRPTPGCPGRPSGRRGGGEIGLEAAGSRLVRVNGFNLGLGRGMESMPIEPNSTSPGDLEQAVQRLSDGNGDSRTVCHSPLGSSGLLVPTGAVRFVTVRESGSCRGAPASTTVSHVLCTVGGKGGVATGGQRTWAISGLWSIRYSSVAARNHATRPRDRTHKADEYSRLRHVGCRFRTYVQTACSGHGAGGRAAAVSLRSWCEVQGRVSRAGATQVQYRRSVSRTATCRVRGRLFLARLPRARDDAEDERKHVGDKA